MNIRLHLILVVFLSIVLPGCNRCPSVPVENDREKAGLNGPVKTVVWKTSRHLNIKFDTLKNWKTEEYAKNGNLINTSYDATKVHKYFQHNQWGQTTQILQFDNDRNLVSILYRKYDGNGRLNNEYHLDYKQYRWFFIKGKLIRTWDYKWDDDNHKFTISICDLAGMWIEKEERYYDDRGRMIRQNSINPNNFIIEYVFDEVGKLIQSDRKQLNEQNKWDQTIIEYDGWEKPLKRENLIWHDTNAQKILRGYEYVPDDHGNWTEQREFLIPANMQSVTDKEDRSNSEKKISRIDLREITYYPE